VLDQPGRRPSTLLRPRCVHDSAFATACPATQPDDHAH
jgi:hypothetical protein